MAANLVLHCGAREVTIEELDQVEAPPPTTSWFPIKHSLVVDAVGSTLRDAGFGIGSMRLGLSRSNTRFFGTLTLTAPLASGVRLAVGIRNSCDKSYVEFDVM